jgi:hypothetical protein
MPPEAQAFSGRQKQAHGVQVRLDAMELGRTTPSMVAVTDSGEIWRYLTRRHKLIRVRHG